MEENVPAQSDTSADVVALRASVEGALRTADEATRMAEGVRSSVGKTASDLGQLKAQADEIRTRISQVVAESQSQLSFLTMMRERAAETLKEVEEVRRKADSESGFAFNAKQNAEDHAKVIAQIRGTVEATFSGLTATKASIDEATSSITSLRAVADLEAKSVTEIKTNSTREAAQVVAAVERVQAVMPSIDQGSKDANAITALKGSVEATATALQTLQTQVSEAASKAMADGTSIAKSDIEAKALLVSMSDAVASAQTANAQVIAHEQELGKLKQAFGEMQKKLEGLLPHATSAGLASAFHTQRARFAKPQPYWLALFVFAILGLLLATALGLPAVSDTWDAILRHFINRLPVVAPLVWLAIYAGHQFNMALRMEEDYAFKEAVSTAFEGYKREMTSIPTGEGSTTSPLVTLCENVLQALAERPGRIYEGRTDVVTPLTPILNTFKDAISEAMKGKNSPAQAAGTTPPTKGEGG